MTAAGSASPTAAGRNPAPASPPGRGAAASGTGSSGATSGLAAARAAAANARAAGSRPGAKAAANAGWADGSPAEEAPYDPEFDAAPGKATTTAGYDGFDPGDEPLDVVIDEKTARESSEQQAMRLLQEAFGAEKIGES